MDKDETMHQLLVAVGKLQGEVEGITRHILDLGDQLTDLKVSFSKELSANAKEISDLKVSFGICDSQVKSIIPVAEQVNLLTTRVDMLNHDIAKRARLEMLILTPLITAIVLGFVSMSWWIITKRIKLEFLKPAEFHQPQ